MSHVGQGVVFTLQFVCQHRVFPVEARLLLCLILTLMHISPRICEVHLKFCPRFFHVRALIPLLEIFRQDSRMIDDGVYFYHYFPIVNRPPCIQIELLDLKGDLHNVCKGGAVVPCLLEPRLFLRYHERVYR